MTGGEEGDPRWLERDPLLASLHMKVLFRLPKRYLGMNCRQAMVASMEKIAESSKMNPRMGKRLNVLQRI